MDNQLKPCPFCGNPDIQRGRAEIGNRPTFHTYCNGCEAGTQGHPTREASDEAWNRRAALAPSDAVQAPTAWLTIRKSNDEAEYTDDARAVERKRESGNWNITPLYAAPVGKESV